MITRRYSQVTSHLASVLSETNGIASIRIQGVVEGETLAGQIMLNSTPVTIYCPTRSSDRTVRKGTLDATDYRYN
jgi:hypothetical protein